MDMGVDPAGGHNVSFATDYFGSRANNNVHVRLHIGIAGLSNRGNASVLDRDIRFHNPPVVQYQRVCDDGIDGAFATRALRLAHSVAYDFSAPELHFLSICCEVLLYLDDEVAIRKAHFVANRWAEHLRISFSTHLVRH